MTFKILFSVLIFFSINCYAQEKSTPQKQEITIGYGVCNIQRVIIFQNATFKGYGTFHLKYDYFLNNNFSIGATINYAGITETDEPLTFNFYNNSKYQAPSFDIKHRALSTNCRINFHGYNKDGLDIYFGFGIGLNYVVTIQNDMAVKRMLPGFECSLGLKYQWADNSGFFTEIGMTKSLLQVGTYFKF